MSWVFLAITSLTFLDPAGDAHGDGSYILPAQPAYNANALDLRSVSVQKTVRGTLFTISLSALQNPWELSSGYSAGVTDIFVKTGLGGIRDLADLGLRTSGAGGWQYHVRVTGARATLKRAMMGSLSEESNEVPLEELSEPFMTIKGTNLIIDTAIPYGKHAYWVTQSVYSPLSKDGVVHPSTSKSPTALRVTRTQAPTPVDILAPVNDYTAFKNGEVAPMGQTVDNRPLFLVGLGALGILLMFVATWRVWTQ